MLKFILAVIVAILMMIGGLAVALYHFFGWQGLVAFPIVLIGTVWVGKIISSRLIKRFFLRLFSLKSRVLRGATMMLHSVTAVAKPTERSGVDDFGNVGTTGSTAAETNGAPLEPAEDADEAESPKHFFDVDVTISPKVSTQNVFWEPGELILTTQKISSLMDLESGDKEAGTAYRVGIWDGSTFGPDDPGKYPGEQRLKITFAVRPDVFKTWLHYYDVPIGRIDLPTWKPD